MDGPNDNANEAQNNGLTTSSFNVSLRARIALWSAALLVLTATFLAYDQIALALQWVVMKLC